MDLFDNDRITRWWGVVKGVIKISGIWIAGLLGRGTQDSTQGIFTGGDLDERQ